MRFRMLLFWMLFDFATTRIRLRISNIGVSRVVVYRLEVFAFDDEAFDASVGNQRGGYVAHHVFHEFRVFIGFFGNVFFVGAFEQTVKLAACLRFYAVDDFLDTDFGIGSQADGNVRALVVCAVLLDFFGTRTQRGHGYHDFQIMAVCAVFDFACQGNVVVQQGLDAGNRRGFFAEEGEGNADFAGMRV